MRAIQLETKTLSIIDSLKQGSVIEDDVVECKRDWPDASKARQLAGLLNRARGEVVTYLIGVDEGDGSIHSPEAREVSEWWDNLTSSFSDVKPELLAHVNVVAGANGENVVALAIASDRAPYLVRPNRDGDQLEVPIRDGTRTRSARRNELLRMLAPTIKKPNAVPLSAWFSLNLGVPATSRDGRDEPQHYYLNGAIRAFIEPQPGELTTLPLHSMKAAVTFDNLELEPKLSVHVPKQNETVGTAVEALADGITVARPGAIHLKMAMQPIDPDFLLGIYTDEDARVRLQMPVVHTEDLIDLEFKLVRTMKGTSGLSHSMVWKTIGEF